MKYNKNKMSSTTLATIVGFASYASILKITWMIAFVPEKATGFEQSDAVANFCEPTVVMSGGSGFAGTASTARPTASKITAHSSLKNKSNRVISKKCLTFVSLLIVNLVTSY